MMQPQPKAVEEKKLGLERYGLEDGSYQAFTDSGQVLALSLEAAPGGPGTVRTRVMLPDKAWSGPPRPLPQLQTKLSLPSRWQRPRTTAWVCFRAVVRS